MRVEEERRKEESRDIQLKGSEKFSLWGLWIRLKDRVPSGNIGHFRGEARQGNLGSSQQVVGSQRVVIPHLRQENSEVAAYADIYIDLH